MKTYIPVILITVFFLQQGATAQVLVGLVYRRTTTLGNIYFYNGAQSLSPTSTFSINIAMDTDTIAWASVPGAPGVPTGYNPFILHASDVENGIIKVTVTGVISGTCYLFRKTSTNYNGGYEDANINQSMMWQSGKPITSDIFSGYEITINDQRFAYGDTTTVDGGEVPAQEVNPDITGPGMDENGKVKIEKQDLADLPGQTTKFWGDWKVAIKSLDSVQNNEPLLNVAEIPSKGANWGRELSFHDGDNAPADWYRGSTIKDMVDVVFLGFSTFAAFLMPYNELRKGV